MVHSRYPTGKEFPEGVKIGHVQKQPEQGLKIGFEVIISDGSLLPNGVAELS